MRARIFFIAVAGFWLVMNYLLLRTQWDGHTGIGSSVPAETVWNKILTAPDNSTLDIFNHDERIGMGRWEVGTANSPLISSKVLAPDYVPGQPIPKLTGYGLSFEGTAMVNGTNHMKFQCSLMLDTNKVWQVFKLRVNMRPEDWEIYAAAASQTVELKSADEEGEWEKTLKFSDLQNPQAVLADFSDPVTIGLLGLNRGLIGNAKANMPWTSREDTIKFGQSKIRVYRLESFFLGQHFQVIVSRIGEILRVDLPFDYTLRNQALGPNGN